MTSPRRVLTRFVGAAVGAAVVSTSLFAVPASADVAPAPALTVGTENAVAPVVARTADSLVDSYGVVVHPTYSGTPYMNKDATLARLRQLGVRHIRTAMLVGRPDLYTTLSNYNAAGIRSDLVMGTPNGPSTPAQLVAAVATKLPAGSVDSLEGANEWNLSGDANWVANLRKHQSDLYSAAKAEPKTAQIPVLAPALGLYSDYANLGDLSSVADYGNLHLYTGGMPPTFRLDGLNQSQRLVTGNKPIVYSEAGYHNALNSELGHYATPEPVVGSYAPRLVLEHFLRGDLRTYTYELYDDYADPDRTDQESNFGLIRNDNTLKPAFTSMQNLLALTSDPGAAFTPGSLRYALNGASSDVRQVLVQKRDGRFYLMLWRDVSIYDRVNEVSVPVDAVPVQVNLGLNADVKTFTPSASATATSTSAAVNQITVPLAGEVVALEITPSAVVTKPAAPVAVTGTPAATAAAVTWSAAPYDGGSAVTGYRVQAQPGGATVNVAAAARTATVPGLANGTSYSFTVTALNAKGASAPSAPSLAVVPRTVPSAPTAVAATPGNGTLALSWAPPAVDGGAPVSGYQVDLTPGGASVSLPASAGATTLNGLTNGTAYTARVSALNAAGSSGAAVAGATPRTVPGAPTDLTAAPQDGAATVGWTAPAGDGGSPVRQYRIEAIPDGATALVDGASTSGTVSGLANGTSYVFKVVALNDAGESVRSLVSPRVTPYTTPDEPTAVSASPRSQAAVVSWAAPAFTGGSPITGYRVEAVPADGSTTVLPGVRSTTVSGLTNGTSYAFRVVATNAAGDSAPSALSAPVVPRTVPDAPTGLVAVAGDSSAAVTWTAPAWNGGAPITGYRVDALPDGGSVSVGATARSASLTGLSNGTAYTFKVVALNAAGASAPSAGDLETPMTVPDAPSAVSASPLNASASVSWTAPAWNGGSPITGYRVDSVSSDASVTVGGSARTATVKNLTNGTSYTLQVVAVNAAGESVASATVAVTPRTVPGAPTGVVAVPADGSAAVSWVAPVATGGMPITGYRVDALPDGGSVSVGAAARSVTVSGLTNGTAYTFKVVAQNVAGASAASVGDVETPFTTPDAPGSVTASARSQSAVVSWAAPGSNGGSPVTGYRVESVPADGSVTVGGSARSATVTGLVNGTSYSFTVVATNAAGDSVSSAVSAAVTPRTVPGAPTGVVAVPADSSAAVSWVAPVATGGMPITGYRVDALPDGGSVSVGAAARSVTVSGLTNGTAYTFKVVAQNVAGASAASVGDVETPFTTPDAPGSVTASPRSQSAVVSWAAPGSNGGSPVTGYRVESVPADGSVTVGGSARSATVTGLVNGTSYTFTVVATNAAGDSVSSTVSAAVTPRTVPGAPSGVAASPADSAALVSWVAPASNGGSAVTAYRIDSVPATSSTVVAGTARSVTVPGLTNGTSYTFRVVATNAAGDSAQSAASTAVVPRGVPTAPTAVSASPGDGSAAVSWTAPSANGGSAISGYRVESVPAGGSVQVGAAARTATVPGLVNGTSYTFRVFATNPAGDSPASAPSAAVVPRAVPGTPSAVSAVGSDGAVLVSWGAPSTDGGSAVTGYRVQVSPGAQDLAFAADATSATVSGLANGTAYTFRVLAVNAAGSSAVPASATATPRTVPGSPSAVSAVGSDGAVLVSWGAPSTDGGSAVTGYRVQVSPGAQDLAFAADATSATVSGLANGTAYTFRVLAVNAAGSSAVPASATATPRTVPGAPAGAAATAGNASAVVTWTAPSATGGSAITGYRVDSVPAGGSVLVGAGARTATVTGLVNGTSYSFRVVAQNAAGDSAASAPSGAVVPRTVPGAPTGASAVAGNASAAVTWTAPSVTGGSAITGYRVDSVPAGGSVQVGAAARTATVTGLVNGTSYTFRVVAQNAAGDSAAGSTAPVTPVAPVTLLEQSDLQLGTWRNDVLAGGAAGRVSGSLADAVVFTFSGTSVTWRTQVGPDQGLANVKIDGVLKGQVDLYRATAGASDVAYTGLATGAHSLTVDVLGKRNTASTGTDVAVDGFTVGTVRYDDTAAALTFSGWTVKADSGASGGSWVQATAAGKSAGTTFTGTAFDWVTVTGPAYGQAEVFVDGASCGVVDLSSAVVTTGVRKTCAGLAAGAHTVVITVIGAKGAAGTGTAVAVDALLVQG